MCTSEQRGSAVSQLSLVTLVFLHVYASCLCEAFPARIRAHLDYRCLRAIELWLGPVCRIRQWAWGEVYLDGLMKSLAS